MAAAGNLARRGPLLSYSQNPSGPYPPNELQCGAHVACAETSPRKFRTVVQTRRSGAFRSRGARPAVAPVAESVLNWFKNFVRRGRADGSLTAPARAAA